MSTEKIELSSTDKENEFKSAVWALLNDRTTAFERKSVSVDVGDDEEILMKNQSFAKAVENMTESDYECIFSQIYAIAFKRGFNAGYGNFYEDIKHLMD